MARAAQQATQTGRAVAPVAEGNLPEGYDLEHIMEDVGAGVTDMGAGDLGIPYLTVLQTNSPQVNPAHAKYIPEAKAGFFMNTATGEVFEGPVNLVPCAYERKLVQWKDRDSGEGGYVTDHPADSDILTKTKPNAKNKPALPNGDVIWETAYQYCLMLNEHTGRWDQVVFPLKSTALKINRRWNNLISGAVVPGTSMQAPRWLFPYEVRTTLEQKANNSWFNISVEKLDRPVSREVYDAGKRFNQLFASGAITRDLAGEAATGDAHAEPAGDAGGRVGDDKIPY